LLFEQVAIEMDKNSEQLFRAIWPLNIGVYETQSQL
jgi:hypothetical protein